MQYRQTASSRLDASHTGPQAAGRHDRDLHALAIDNGAGTVFAFAELGTGAFVWIAPRQRRCSWWSSAIIIDASGLALMSSASSINDH
jgi:hypothetical protein